MNGTLPDRLTASPLAIRTEGLRKRFGSTIALDGIDLTVPEGAVYVLVGPNGAGKTTALRIFMDLVRPDGGSARILDLDPRADGPHLRANVGYLPEVRGWEHGWMKVRRLMEHHARYYTAWDTAYAARLVKRLDVQLDRPFGKLSKGQSRRAQLVMALAHRPRILLLDEPTDGLDPVAREETLSVLADHLAASPATLLVSTHLVHEIERLADHIGVLREGRLRAQVTTDALHANLRGYQAEVPEGWSGAPGLNGTVVRRRERGREIVWTIWGEEERVRAELQEAGAEVHAVSPLTLEEAAVALLSTEEVNDVR